LIKGEARNGKAKAQKAKERRIDTRTTTKGESMAMRKDNQSSAKLM
jgi:hypothetical protein